MKLARLLAVMVLTTLPAAAQLTETFTFDTFGGNPQLQIPDGNATGVSDARLVSSTMSQIVSLEVSLNLQGNFNGDLYLYLRHDSVLSVLLNRVGRTASNPFGYDDSGFNVSLSDTAANGDIHTYRAVLTPPAGQPLTDVWQPDGRDIDPSLSVDTTPRTAGLGVFTDSNPNGEWRLFAADLQNGGLTQIESWSLLITSVPEPRHFAILTAGLLVLFAIGRRALG